MKDFSKIKPHIGHVYAIYDWCKSKYGRSRYNGRYPDIEFKKSDYYNGEDWGYFEPIDKLIFINRDKHETLEDVVDTIIHEYTHYKQSMFHYQILAIYLDPHENPLEKQAEEVAQRDSQECLAYLQTIFRKKSILKNVSS